MHLIAKDVNIHEHSDSRFCCPLRIEQEPFQLVSLILRVPMVVLLSDGTCRTIHLACIMYTQCSEQFVGTYVNGVVEQWDG